MMVHLEAARTAGADLQAGAAQLFSKMSETRVSRTEDNVEKFRGSFRVLLKEHGHTYFRPVRLLQDEALEDANSLLAAADTSIAALEAAEKRLFLKETG